jgi:hypothetical protein
VPEGAGIGSAPSSKKGDIMKQRGRITGRKGDNRIKDGVHFFCTLPPELYERLQQEAQAANLTMAKVYRIALKKFFDSIDESRRHE